MLSLLFASLGIFFLVNSVIMLRPHQISDDKKEGKTQEEAEVANAYLYEHEKGGDRYLRMQTGYVLIALSVHLILLAFIAYFGLTEDLEIKNNYVKFFGGILLLGVVGMGIYYGIYKSGALNEKANKNFTKVETEMLCRAEGIQIIYKPCVGTGSKKIYDECILDVRSGYEAKCARDIVGYKTVISLPPTNRQLEKNKLSLEKFNLLETLNLKDPTDEVLTSNNLTREEFNGYKNVKSEGPTNEELVNHNLSRATFNFYRDIDNSLKVPLSCDRIVSTQEQNDPKSMYCQTFASQEFLKTDTHKDCTKKSRKQN